MHLTRRELLFRAAGLGAAAAGVLSGGAGLAGLTTALSAAPAAAANVPAPFTKALPIPTVLTDADITLTASETLVPILDGEPTRMWTFNGTFPGPTIRRPSGQETRLTIKHELPVDVGALTIHHHGSHSAPEHDGLPADVVANNMIEPGAARTYVYEHMEDGAPERAAQQWYHDHSHGSTSLRSWMGLVGLFILDDDLDASLPLPRGAYELPLFLTDRAFEDESNQLARLDLFEGNAEISGDVALVNGAVQPYADVEPRRYRLRLQNGSGFQTYNLSLAAAGGDKHALVQIGTESGLLEAPLERSDILMAPAERVDVVVDFAGLQGQTLVLRSGSRTPRELVAGTPPQTAGQTGHFIGEFLQFRVGTTITEPDSGPLPATLRPLPEWAAGAASEPDRLWVFGRGIDTQRVDPANPTGLADYNKVVVWSVNGQAFNHTRVDAEPVLGTTETWLLVNASPNTHVIHLHDVDWYVLERNGAAPAAHEQALKESFLMDGGEIVKIATKFTDHTGPYMIHCHMLDHEDDGMMARFDVVASGGSPTVLTGDEQRRTNTILGAIAANPGQPAPQPLLRALERTVRVTAGSSLNCDLAKGDA